MRIPGLKERVSEGLAWPSLRGLLLIATGITVIISLFEIRLDPWAMAREVMSNFITCVTISFVTATLTCALGMYRLPRQWGRFVLLVVVLAIGGVIGGLISWGINHVLFSIHMSHASVYLLIVAALSIIFGLSILAYGTISQKLDDSVARLADKEVQEQRLLRLKTEAELEALRARVNPHFLFNTLNSIASLIPVDPERAEETVQRLSNLFRYILSAGDRGLVPLKEEFGIVSEYLQIEKVRLGERLEYRVDHDGSLDDAAIPGMLLQPLVENAVKYGVAPDRNGGRIDVSSRREGDRCRITIADTGAGFEPAAAEQGFGISSVRQRLELYYPDAHQFDITSGDGVTITINIPVTHDAADDTR